MEGCCAETRWPSRVALGVYTMVAAGVMGEQAQRWVIYWTVYGYALLGLLLGLEQFFKMHPGWCAAQGVILGPTMFYSKMFVLYYGSFFLCWYSMILTVYSYLMGGWAAYLVVDETQKMSQQVAERLMPLGLVMVAVFWVLIFPVLLSGLLAAVAAWTLVLFPLWTVFLHAVVSFLKSHERSYERASLKRWRITQRREKEEEKRQQASGTSEVEFANKDSTRNTEKLSSEESAIGG